MQPVSRDFPQQRNLPFSRAESATVPRVLVLLAAYNGSQWIPDQIESILAQEDVEVRVVARDDNSTDDTPSQLRRFAADSRLTTIFAVRGSGSAAQNFLTLIRTQSSEHFDFVALSDQDDIWFPDKLARACQALNKSGASGYSSATLARWEDGKSILIKPSGAQNSADFLFEGAGQGCTFVLSSSLYERVRQFMAKHADLTESLHFHDWAIYALARSWNLPWIFDAAPSMIYRQHHNNDTGARGSFSGALKRLALIRSGWYRKQVGAICDLCWTAAPENPTVSTWSSALHRPRDVYRRVQLAKLCLFAGRRRIRDNIAVVAACLAGWI